MALQPILSPNRRQSPPTPSAGVRIIHGPVLPLLIISAWVWAGVVLARVLLLPVAKAMQARQGYSDQFVTDLALALPLSAFILGALAGLIWLVR